MALSTCDPTSYSEPEKCQLKSLDWDVEIDFDAHTIGGYAHLTFENKESPNFLLLDVRDLTIEEVAFRTSGQQLEFVVDNPLKYVAGSRLKVQLGTITEKSFEISIKYVTSPNATALQWMNPQQTAGRRQPYVYSQCQAIHARSLFPCQDTPTVKFSYTAKVRAPREITVLMSAKRLDTQPVPGDSSRTETSFSLKVPIPSYLVAIVGGDLESRDIGPRSKVWSEREFVDRAAYEFAETEQMLKTAEELMGPYVWGHYDLLVLPPSFPYGGMENPCLTFVTPTLLAGDRSLASVIAHEISHSWTGNLVTNKTFQDLWLNEGHTVFVERKILGRMFGEPHRQLHADEGWKTLRSTVEQLQSDGNVPYTKLIPELIGIDPDDAFSTVPYEKGFALLYHLETMLGGSEVFEAFLRAYIERFKYLSIDAEQWKEFLFQYFSSEEDQKILNNVDWDAWFKGSGLPPYQPNYDLSLAVPCHALSQQWISQPDDQLDIFSPNDLQGFPSMLTREFVTQLYLAEPPLSLTKVQGLEQVYHFNSVRNSEFRLKWLQLCIKVRWNDCVQLVLDFINEQGRMKFVRPLYRALYAWEEIRPRAISNFTDHRPEMHNITVNLVAKDLHLQ